jgi:bacterial/archaeal transporter family protein
MENWKYFAILSMLFAGITSVIAKLGMKNLSSDVALSVRTFIVFALVSANAFIFHNVYLELKDAPKSNLIFLIVSGITTTLSWVFYYRAMKVGPVAYIASIDKASIVITILLSFLILKEPITPKLIVGGLFIITGMLVLVWK